jgi:hypothetical protein
MNPTRLQAGIIYGDAILVVVYWLVRCLGEKPQFPVVDVGRALEEKLFIASGLGEGGLEEKKD